MTGLGTGHPFQEASLLMIVVILLGTPFDGITPDDTPHAHKEPKGGRALAHNLAHHRDEASSPVTMST